MERLPIIVDEMMMITYKSRSSCFLTKRNIKITPISLQAAFFVTVYLNCSIPAKNQEISNIVESSPIVRTR